MQANVDFTVSTDADWITQVETRGLAERMLCFDVAPNEGEEMREATIVLLNGELKQVIVVRQAEREETIIPSLQLSMNSYTANSEGSTLEVVVQSNIDYQVQFSDVDWIIDKGNVGNSHRFQILPNETADTRKVDILFVNKEYGLEEKLVVIQLGKEDSNQSSEMTGNGESYEEENGMWNS